MVERVSTSGERVCAHAKPLVALTLTHGAEGIS